MAGTPYNEAFYAFHEQRSRTSARETIPLVLQYLSPKSVVDVGCGIGTWLAEFQAAGISDLLGIDGDYVRPTKLLIDAREFRACDLAHPFALDRRFDLAISLEVAEHLPPESADAFVASVARLAPVVLFSAAIPNDSGDGHVNEQFPEYWQQKFLDHDFVVVDCLRRRLWNNPNVAAYYRQDMLFFVERRSLGNYPRLAEEFARAGEHPPLSYVHPETYLAQHAAMTQKIRESQCLAMRYAVRLREINLVVFPDWSRSPQSNAAEIGQLLRALIAHPDRRRIALVIHVGADSEGSAGRILRRLIRGIVTPSEHPQAENPEIVAIGPSFGPNQWEVLMACMQWRVALKFEDQDAVTVAKAEHFPILQAAVIQANHPFANT